jgi:hypothetical protein
VPDEIAKFYELLFTPSVSLRRILVENWDKSQGRRKSSAKFLSLVSFRTGITPHPENHWVKTAFQSFLT